MHCILKRLDPKEQYYVRHFNENKMPQNNHSWKLKDERDRGKKSEQEQIRRNSLHKQHVEEKRQVTKENVYEKPKMKNTQHCWCWCKCWIKCMK